MEFLLLLTVARGSGEPVLWCSWCRLSSEELPAFSADLAKSVIYPWTAMEIPCTFPAKSWVLSSMREVLICCWPGTLPLWRQKCCRRQGSINRCFIHLWAPPFFRTLFLLFLCYFSCAVPADSLGSDTPCSTSLAFPESNEPFTWWKKTFLIRAEYKCLESLIITTSILLLICVVSICLFCFGNGLMQSKLVLNSCSSCLHLPGTGTPCMSHHT